MQNILRKTQNLAHEYLQSFGFEEEQIETLIKKGTRDLKNELEKLYTLLENENTPIEELNNALHALKGLLFHLGNNALAQELNEVRSQLHSSEDIAIIKNILKEHNQ